MTVFKTIQVITLKESKTSSKLIQVPINTYFYSDDSSPIDNIYFKCNLSDRLLNETFLKENSDFFQEVNGQDLIKLKLKNLLDEFFKNENINQKEFYLNDYLKQSKPHEINHSFYIVNDKIKDENYKNLLSEILNK